MHLLAEAARTPALSTSGLLAAAVAGRQVDAIRLALEHAQSAAIPEGQEQSDLMTSLHEDAEGPPIVPQEPQGPRGLAFDLTTLQAARCPTVLARLSKLAVSRAAVQSSEFRVKRVHGWTARFATEHAGRAWTSTAPSASSGAIAGARRWSSGLLPMPDIPPKFKRAELSTSSTTWIRRRAAYSARDRVRVEAFPGRSTAGCCFHGPPGVGKTHLAIGILKEVIRDKGARGISSKRRKLLRLVRDTYNRSVEETEMDVLSPVLEADLLVLDDLGAGRRYSEWVQGNARASSSTPVTTPSGPRSSPATSMTTSPTAPTATRFVFQLGVRTRSRLLEMCELGEDSGRRRARGRRTMRAPKTSRRWKKDSPGSPENIAKAQEKSEAMARALLTGQRRQARQYELNWSGGKR